MLVRIKLNKFQDRTLLYIEMEDLRVKGLRREVAQNRAEWRSATT